MRRNSRDPFYRKILARYVHMATEGGVTQAMFPEGGLSIDGKLRPPKLGLLSYMVGEFDPRGPRDVLFIPVGINYDRVLEDRMLTGVAAKLEQDPTAKARYPVRHTILLKFLAKSLWQVVRGRWYRYGYACVSFGAPVSLRDYIARENFDFRTLDDDARFAQTKRLGEHLMDRVAEVVPALPVSLVAAALLGAGGAPLSEFEVNGRVHQLMEQIKAGGGHIHIPRSDMAYAIEVGLRMLTLRRLVVEENGTYRVVAAEERLLRYYANAIGGVE